MIQTQPIRAPFSYCLRWACDIKQFNQNDISESCTSIQKKKYIFCGFVCFLLFLCWFFFFSVEFEHGDLSYML